MSPDSSCPSTQELEAFTEGRLTGGDLTRMLGHLAECTSCQEQFRRLSSKEDDSPRQASGPALGQLQGSTLGQYQLLEPVGGGGMGVVYKALHVKLRQVVALKTMTRAALADPQSLARFQREMAALGGLIHPNIVRATDAGEADGWHYLVMEFVEGIDLNQLVKLCGPLRVADACELIRQAACGLQFIHENKRVHRDLKPSNLMLTLDGQTKILDLGLALLHEDAASEELTSSRQVMGTADYMAPEQARSAHDVDIRADLYSLGCTLYKLLTGAAPFSQMGGERAKKRLAHAEQPPPAIGDNRADVPREVTAVVQRLLAKAPADRFQQPSELVTALAASTAGHDLVTLVRTAQALRVERSVGADAVHRKETVPFNVDGIDGMRAGAGKATPTPTTPESSRPKPRARRKTRIALAATIAAVCLAALLTWRWSIKREEPEGDGLPWPDDYPAALKDMPWGKPVALVDKKPWRSHEFGEKFRGGSNVRGETFQPLWCRRLLGDGSYYEESDLKLFAADPPSLTFMELSRDERRRWFEMDIDLMSVVLPDWVGGCYLGWQQAKPGQARTYLLMLERGVAENRLWLAPVEVRWQRVDQAEPVHPFVPIDRQKTIALRAPSATGYNKVRIRASPNSLSVAVEGGQEVSVAPALDVRGSVGLWVQHGWAHCRRLLYTPLRSSDGSEID